MLFRTMEVSCQTRLISRGDLGRRRQHFPVTVNRDPGAGGKLPDPDGDFPPRGLTALQS